MSRSFYRILAIPEGEEKDAEGRGLGDDWLVADLGVHEDENGVFTTHYYVTTDRVHASEFDPEVMGCDPPSLAADIVAILNAKLSPAARRKEREPTEAEAAFLRVFYAMLTETLPSVSRWLSEASRRVAEAAERVRAARAAKGDPVALENARVATEMAALHLKGCWANAVMELGLDRPEGA